MTNRVVVPQVCVSLPSAEQHGEWHPLPQQHHHIHINKTSTTRYTLCIFGDVSPPPKWLESYSVCHEVTLHNQFCWCHERHRTVRLHQSPGSVWFSSIAQVDIVTGLQLVAPTVMFFFSQTRWGQSSNWTALWDVEQGSHSAHTAFLGLHVAGAIMLCCHHTVQPNQSGGGSVVWIIFLLFSLFLRQKQNKHPGPFSPASCLWSSFR